METLPEMRARHRREVVEQVQALAESRYTQTEAARILGVSLTCLNNLVRRERISWPVIRQGKRRAKHG